MVFPLFEFAGMAFRIVVGHRFCRVQLWLLSRKQNPAYLKDKELSQLTGWRKRRESYE